MVLTVSCSRPSFRRACARFLVLKIVIAVGVVWAVWRCIVSILSVMKLVISSLLLRNLKALPRVVVSSMTLVVTSVTMKGPSSGRRILSGCISVYSLRLSLTPMR